MNMFKDKKIIALIVVMTLFTISYFIIVGKSSYAFRTDNLATERYNKTIDMIKKCALTYASNNKNLFKEENIVYIKVQR